VHSAKRRHQSPEWTILSHSYRLIQGEIVRPQVLLDSLHPCSTSLRGRPGGLLQFSEGEAVMILLASVSSGILAMWPNRERRRAWTIADRLGCPVVRLTSSFRTWWYHLIPNNFHKRHWSRASILSTSLLVTAEHSEPNWRSITSSVLVCLDVLVGTEWRGRIWSCFVLWSLRHYDGFSIPTFTLPWCPAS